MTAKEIDRIRGKYRATLQSMHACAHLDVKRVFSVEIGAMHRAFEAEGRKIGGVRRSCGTAQRPAICCPS